jgi:HEAT repeat protein
MNHSHQHPTTERGVYAASTSEKPLAPALYTALELPMAKRPKGRAPMAARSALGWVAVVVSALLLLAVPLQTLAKTDAAAAAKAKVSQLSAVLKSNASEKEKADACRELARVGTKEAVPALAALLSDEKLSHMARYGLETIPHSSVDQAFRAALDKLQGRQLVGVLGSIGVRRDTGAVKGLAKLLSNTDPEVAQAAARALGSIGNAAAAAALQKAVNEVPATNQLAVCEGLLRCAEALAADGSTKKALAIYDQLRAMSLPHQVRIAAWRGAVLNRDKDGLPLLLQALDSKDFALSAAAMRISQEMRGNNVTAALADRLQTFPEDRQIILAQTLGRRVDPTALPALFTVAAKGPLPVRLAAIRALPTIGHPSAVPILVDLMKEEEAEVAQAAQEALAGMQGPEADTAVLHMVLRGPVARRITGMDLIVRRRMTSAIPQLLEAGEDLEPRIRVAAVKKVGELAGPQEIPAVVHLLERAKTQADLDAVEQGLTALALKAQDPATVTARLGSQMSRLRPGQQCALLQVLAAVGGSNALKAVHTGINSHEPEVHSAAIRALSSWSTADAAPLLLELARVGGGSTDQMLCLRGYLRLAALPDLDAEKRLAMCRDVAPVADNAGEKKLLLAALSGIDSPASLQLIARYFDDPANKEEAAAAATEVSEKLLQGAEGNKLAPQIVPALEKAQQATSNAALTKRIQGLLDKAQSKRAAK